MDRYINKFLMEKKNYYNISDKTMKAYFSDLRQLNSYCIEKNVSFEKGLLLFIDYQQDTLMLKPRTLRRKMITYKMFYKFLLDEEVITYSQIFRNKKTSYIIPKNLPKTISLIEINKLLLSMYALKHKNGISKYKFRDCVRDIALMEVLISTGLRIGEISLITLKDYNLEENSLLVQGKNRKERLIYISSEDVRQAIKDYLFVRKEYNPKEDYLFINKYGEKLSIYGIENIFYKYRDAAGINPSATPHYLRHTFATELLNNGANIREVQELLGHSSITTTEIYTAVSMKRKKEVLTNFNYRNKIQVKTSK